MSGDLAAIALLHHMNFFLHAVPKAPLYRIATQTELPEDDLFVHLGSRIFAGSCKASRPTRSSASCRSTRGTGLRGDALRLCGQLRLKDLRVIASLVARRGSWKATTSVAFAWVSCLGFQPMSYIEPSDDFASCPRFWDFEGLTTPWVSGF